MSIDHHTKRKREADIDDTEKLLAKKLFGNSASLFDANESSGEDESEVSETLIQDDDGSDPEASSSLKPVWHDEDDDELLVDIPAGKRSAYLRRATDVEGQKVSAKEYEKRLREAFNRVHSAGNSKLKWASIQTTKPSQKTSKDDDSDFEDIQETLNEMVASTGKYVTTGDFLPKGIINFKRLNDITRGHRLGKKPLTAVQFHATKPVLMTAGENGVLNFFEVGLPPTKEAFLQNTCFKNFPITTARFSIDGLRVYLGSRRQVYLFSYDLLEAKVIQMRTPKEMTNMNSSSFVLSPDGKFIAIVTRNEINVLSIASMELLYVLSTSSMVHSLQFSSSSSYTLLALTETSEVCIWDIRNSSELQTFRDDGGVRGSAFRISHNGQFLACGSNTGIVNLYETKDIYGLSDPKPVKVFDQLTTRVDDVVFNTDSQILLISSNVKKNAVRLAHTRSRTVFTNFPSRTVNIGKPTVSDFSPNSGYMAIGDTKGFLSLFRLHHFERY